MQLLCNYIIKTRIEILKNLYLHGIKLYSTSSKERKILKDCYKILEIPEKSDQEEIRRAYLALVRRYHPDNAEGDLKMFQQVDKAFRTITEHKSKERWKVDEETVPKQAVKEFDIKHTAPQHRQYLSFDGYGSGTIFQREKQYAKIRAFQASENVMQHRIAKVTADEKALLHKAPLKHKIKTKYGLDRLVEDLIQESMSKGEFNNLSGTGKPLKDQQFTNPHVDFITYKLNQVLIENGFAPEWIMLQKEIREEIQQLKDKLSSEREYLGKHPLETNEEIKWSEIVSKHTEFTTKLNKKIEKYNLLVPMLNKQMVGINLSKIADNILTNGKFGSEKLALNEGNSNDGKSSNYVGLLGIFDFLFKK